MIRQQLVCASKSFRRRSFYVGFIKSGILPYQHSFLNPKKPILEIGSGASFLSEYIPNAISSDLQSYPWLSIVIDGHRLPFVSEALHAIVMNNVFHHMPWVEDFFSEATRCVEIGGLISMIESRVTQ